MRSSALFAAASWLALCGAAAAQVSVVAAGDIACDPADPDYRGGSGTASRCHQRATSDLALALAPDAVLLLGDNQYLSGDYSAYQASFGPSWGRLQPRLRPAPGNHEYLTPGAFGYFNYFGQAAAQGHYSFDLGDWHFVSLDSNCAEVGGCGRGSAEERWLRQDLAAHPGVCTLAYWHHPRFSSGPHGDNPAYAAFWQALVDGGADLVLAGHDHDYERFAPQDASGMADAQRGLREFVVGTGGKDLYAFTHVSANSQVRLADRFGVLRLRLRDGGYNWEFVGEDGEVADAGSAPCHGPEAEEALVLLGSRFRISARWRVGGEEGIARPGPEASGQSGVMWFFEPSNWELLVKVIDGCALNGHYWLFAAGTTDVGFSLEAVDVSTGQERALEHAAGSAMIPVQDTAAFPCN